MRCISQRPPLARILVMARHAAWLRAALLLLVASLAWGCVRETPVTGRKQVLLMPESQEVSLGVAAYQDVLKNEQLSTNPHYIELVNRVGKRIATATGEQYDWEFKVIASDVQNAFCLPGGKVAVYEGILPICENEAGLAVVMSHEIAHAVARHGGERLSQGMMVNGAKKAVAWVTQDLEETNRQITLAAFGVVTEVGFVLPYSRAHESEADSMGLVYMAKAGYDPAEAPRFWQRFAAATAGAEKQPEFLSTHPADDRRAKELQEQLPSALELYREATAQYGLGQRIPQRHHAALVGGAAAANSHVQPAAHHAFMPPGGTSQLSPSLPHSVQPHQGGASPPGTSQAGGGATWLPSAAPLGIQGCLNGNCNHSHHAASSAGNHLAMPPSAPQPAAPQTR